MVISAAKTSIPFFMAQKSPHIEQDSSDSGDRSLLILRATCGNSRCCSRSSQRRSRRASAAMGFLWLATVPPTTGLVAVFFGTRYMTFLYGIVFLSHQVGSFIGVWLGGLLYEIFGNYDAIWIVGAVLGVIAALLHWPIKEQSHISQLQRVPAR